MLSTSKKILIARYLSKAVLFVRGCVGLPATVIAKRRGISWSLDLRDGVDFAIYLLGGFEVRTLDRYRELIAEGDVVLDIGANVGSHTLPLAQLVGGTGRVISFEPTAHAFAKQKANISLNPTLAKRIDAHQMMLMASASEAMPEAVYSSWPLEVAEDLHSEHHGRLMSTQGARLGTLDETLRDLGLVKVDFIKLDVDGNELAVLLGAAATLNEYQPRIMLELAPYVYADNPGDFDRLLKLLWKAGYEIGEMASGRKLPEDADKVRAMIAEGGGMNVLVRSKNPKGR
ncbi:MULTISPECIES: FkbM family methyltransferase [Rhizobium]|uniref:FkbM family methyltransferase n=1 Tax=Rhizobium TaxID=379 RepID=UPI001B3192F5|nr:MULTISPECIES: FkbM family methyltransferase [Rhizobium]MBX4908355.1 FkbM family methyltransferase [Rhizobium bangladeshense]MBX5233571.1 FkbM family methyltransferase [Rhizobium sp. NLR4a]MBX5251210.1 FkbM family methyltransferase [Rhizobium sp. NLR4b]MBX5257488.1 FkbM family methyltransferase [Rhizobium sp. NLR16b]MBX5263580.1 FkbM family methyltransferase [Rhizobium sp. NLR16a]